MIGFHSKRTLPDWVLPGQQVTFKRGAMLRSSHPSAHAGPYPSSRRQTVTVHHNTPGWTMTLGTIYPDGTFYSNQRYKDVVEFAIRMGMSDAWRDSDACFQFLRDCDAAEVKPSRYEKLPDLKHVVLHVQNPSVCWAGTSGYWVEVDIKDLIQPWVP